MTIEELSVREEPDTSSPRIGVLKRKEEVEILETSGGWGKVRNEERHILGWSYMRYLQPLGPAAPVGASRHQPADAMKSATISAKASQEMPR
ncbi:MAG: SH3 domain-containing protein [Syntrophales bacterium]|nr:SH3 domain-containing protein [Syntrophales bacterium]